MGNCSCVNHPPESQFVFDQEQNLNQAEILEKIKSKFENSFISIEPITLEEFDKILFSFPNVKELFEEYNPKFQEALAKDNLITSQSSILESNEKDCLIELSSPIKLVEDGDKFDFFKGSVNKNNNFSGKGIYITSDYVYKGFFHNNEFNGKGLMIYNNGGSLFGDWVNGVCTGKGILKINNQYEYEGDFVENKKQGYGVERYPEGSVYEGEFHDNKKNGKGKYILSGGETYEGDFKDDLFDGEGVYKWPSESREYKGQFKNGNMNGKGINTFKDGSSYEGYYKNGLKHGLGKYTWPNGKVFYGSWLNNKLHGNGYYLLDNEKFNITFRFGKIISTRKAEDIDENKIIKFGYDNIVDKENINDVEKYICPICKYILYQPQKCSGCSENYCIDCIKDGKANKKCIKCGEDNYELNLDLLHDLIKNIKVNCSTCNNILDYETSLNHYHS
jgi:hypothetical protein